MKEDPIVFNEFYIFNYVLSQKEFKLRKFTTITRSVFMLKIYIKLKSIVHWNVTYLRGYTILERDMFAWKKC